MAMVQQEEKKKLKKMLAIIKYNAEAAEISQYYSSDTSLGCMKLTYICCLNLLVLDNTSKFFVTFDRIGGDFIIGRIYPRVNGSRPHCVALRSI